jgi:signal transduction histidine kinase
MIESLLDVYHYEAGAQSLYFDDVDLKLLATTCVEEIKVLASDQGLKVILNLPDNLPTVRADRTAMRRVITNLLDNAIKFTPPDGTIEVRGHTQDGQVILAVEDSGMGIPPEDRAHLFERFWHGVGRKTFKKSNGLGLYLCKQIIDSHHGRIECTSEVGKMTIFRICLPIESKSDNADHPKQLTSAKQQK